MAKKSLFDLIVPILIGVIVLLGVYIIVNQSNQSHVTEVRENVFRNDYYDLPLRSDLFIQQPTYFNPNHNWHTGCDSGCQEKGNNYNIQMKEPFTDAGMTDFLSSLLSRSAPSSRSVPSLRSVPSSHSVPSHSSSPETMSYSFNKYSQSNLKVPENIETNVDPLPMEASMDSVETLPM